MERRRVVQPESTKTSEVGEKKDSIWVHVWVCGGSFLLFLFCVVCSCCFMHMPILYVHLYIYLCCSLCLYLSLSSGQAFCKPVIPCLPGRFDASAGADLTSRRCHDCPAGFFRLDSDESSCLEGAAGRYQSTNGSSACSSCQPGQHQRLTK